MNNFIFSLLPERMRSLLSAILIEVIWADGSQCFPESPSSPKTISTSCMFWLRHVCAHKGQSSGVEESDFPKPLEE